MNETIKALTERRSCKRYLDKHLDEVTIGEIVEAGLHAPSGKNLQTPILAVVRDDATVKKLSAMNAAVLGMGSDPFYGARDVIVVLAKKEGTYVYDGSLTMGNLLNAAYSLGVGACWIHRAKEVFYTEEGKEMLRAWGITDEVEGIGFCTLGYAAETRETRPIRENRVYYI